MHPNYPELLCIDLVPSSFLKEITQIRESKREREREREREKER